VLPGQQDTNFFKSHFLTLLNAVHEAQMAAFVASLQQQQQQQQQIQLKVRPCLVTSVVEIPQYATEEDAIAASKARGGTGQAEVGNLICCFSAFFTFLLIPRKTKTRFRLSLSPFRLNFASVHYHHFAPVPGCPSFPGSSHSRVPSHGLPAHRADAGGGAGARERDQG
jgi:hypothetical protein